MDEYKKQFGGICTEQSGVGAFGMKFYKEDCFLVSNRDRVLENSTFKRLEWNVKGNYKVIYMVNE